MGGQKIGSNSTTAAISGLGTVLQNLLGSCLSDSSTRSYSRAWTLFRTFASDYGLTTDIPVKPDTLALYIAYLFSMNYAASTITSHVSAISYIHKMNNVDDPTSLFMIQKLLYSSRKRRPTQDSRMPITKPILHKLCDALNSSVSNQFEQSMFRAMFLLAFYGFLRIGEITGPINNENNIAYNQITLDNRKVNIKFVKYKHATGLPFNLTIPAAAIKTYCPVHCLQQFVKLRGIGMGPLFSYGSNTPVSRNRFATVLQSCLSFSKLDTNLYKNHSFRIGMACHCTNIGISDSKIRLLGRWKSDAFKSYIRHSH